MPRYKYIGKTTNFSGKTLWEILGNLKDFGVGRHIVRNAYRNRYAEPCYYKILKVEAVADVEYPRKVHAIVEEVFRGVKDGHPVNLFRSSYVPDYRLLTKEEAAEYCKVLPAAVPTKILPRTAELPPLLKEFIMRERKKKGDPDMSEPRLPMSYSPSSFFRGLSKIADEGETPTCEIRPSSPIKPILLDPKLEKEYINSQTNTDKPQTDKN